MELAFQVPMVDRGDLRPPRRLRYPIRTLVILRLQQVERAVTVVTDFHQGRAAMAGRPSQSHPNLPARRGLAFPIPLPSAERAATVGMEVWSEGQQMVALVVTQAR